MKQWRKQQHMKWFQQVRIRDKDRCQLCGKKIFCYYEMSLDHIIARMFGGGNEMENLQLAHKKCNAKKYREIEVPEQRRRIFIKRRADAQKA